MSATLILGKRITEAVLFAAEEPLDLATIQAHLPGDLHARDVIDALAKDYVERGVRLENHGGRYAFRTSPDIGPYLQRETVQSRRLSRAALETLAIIAYHQPITRAEIEEMRGVSTNKGTLDLLIETGWVQPKGRRETPGRPVTWVTTNDFLDHLDLTALDDLPRIEELMQVGLLSGPGASNVQRLDPTDGQSEADASDAHAADRQSEADASDAHAADGQQAADNDDSVKDHDPVRPPAQPVAIQDTDDTAPDH